jgi:hypothetical protein
LRRCCEWPSQVPWSEQPYGMFEAALSPTGFFSIRLPRWIRRRTSVEPGTTPGR